MNIRKISLAAVACVALTMTAPRAYCNPDPKENVIKFEEAILKLDSEGTYNEGLEEIKGIALKGYVPAIIYLAANFKDNPEEFNKWAELGISMGIPEVMAIYSLVLYETDEKEALYWMEKAAQGDNADAAATVGYIYEYGLKSIKPDIEKAIYYYGIGAELQNDQADAFDVCRKGLQRLTQQ